ncbi:MAG: SIMPL domain-containing protein [Bacteroidales bacterium]|nr:SIMPL domain-containing protein [Bacteroidales bacterium]
MNYKKHIIIGGLLLFAGLLSCGYFIWKGLTMFRTGERTVTVRGLAEREVMADHIYWPIAFVVTDNDLAQLNEKIENNRQIIVEFLLKQGFRQEEMAFSSPSVVDVNAQLYGMDRQYPFRYLGKGVVKLNTENVNLVLTAADNSVSLLSEGIVLNSDEYQNVITYSYKGLNSIKPEMIEEANLNAREAAEKFATDSKSKLGKIKSASQGLFSIESANYNTPETKVIRVVTTVQYYLIH